MKVEKKKTKGEEIKEAVEFARKAGMLDSHQHRFKFGNVEIERVTGIVIRNPTTGKRTVWLKNNGDAFFGADIDTPEDVSLITFSSDQEYNDEDVGKGDLLLGDNSAGKANLLWDRSTGQLKFRGGQTVEAYVDTDGAIYAGGGEVFIDSDGLTIRSTLVDYDTPNTIKFQGDTYNAAQIYTLEVPGTDQLTLAIGNSGSSRDADLRIAGIPGSGHDSDLSLIATGPTGVNTVLAVISDSLSSRVAISGVLVINDGITAPATHTGKACIYVDNADGSLKVKFGSGTVKTLATDP